MDEFVKPILDHWHIVQTAPITFAMCAILFLMLGCGLTRLVYKKKIKLSNARLKTAWNELAHFESVLTDERDECMFYRAEAGALSADIERMSIILAGEDPLENDANQSAIYKQIAAKPQPSALLCGNLFARHPEYCIEAAMEQAALLNKLVFVIIYNAVHPTKSNLSYALGRFLQYLTTRKLVDKSFVCALVESSNATAKAFVPTDDALEQCRWVVLDQEGEVLRSQTLCANPDEGLKRTREVLELARPLEC